MSKYTPASTKTGFLPQNRLDRAVMLDHTKLVQDFIVVANRDKCRLVNIGRNSILFKNRLMGFPILADATQAGKIKFTLNGTNVQLVFSINGQAYTKAATDNFWDLSAEVDTAAAKYRAYYLLIDNGGNASFLAQSAADSSSAANALAALLADGPPPEDKCVVGVFVAGPSTDMSADAIVAKANAQIKAGLAEAMYYDWPGQVRNGSTAGKLKVTGSIWYIVNGERYTVQPTDNLWDFSAEVDTASAKYRAYYLLLDNAGAATILAQTGSDSSSAANAIAALLADGEPPANKAVVGVFVAGPSTDMSADAIFTKSGAAFHYALPEAMAYTLTASLLTV